MNDMTLRQIRLAKEITQEKMAELLGIAMNTYRAWEAKPSTISIADCYRICEILAVEYSKSIFLP